MLKSTNLPFLSRFVGALFLAITLFACEDDPCEDAVCAPCPGSRVVIEYQDSLGNCPADFSVNGMIMGVDLLTNDTTLRYNFSDSCTASLLVRENYRYVVRSGSYMDVIDIDAFESQDPLEVTECCLCYPVANVDLSINGDSTRIDYPSGEYDNANFIVKIN